LADDINLHTSNSCFNVLQTSVNLELCKIDHWLRGMFCSFMHFCDSNHEITRMQQGEI